jgi:hypothetical protein
VFDNNSACIPTVVEGSAAEGDGFIALIESHAFVRECLHRSMQSAFSLPVVEYAAVSELELSTVSSAATLAPSFGALEADAAALEGMRNRRPPVSPAPFI